MLILGFSKGDYLNLFPSHGFCVYVKLRASLYFQLRILWTLKLRGHLIYKEYEEVSIVTNSQTEFLFSFLNLPKIHKLSCHLLWLQVRFSVTFFTGIIAIWEFLLYMWVLIPTCHFVRVLGITLVSPKSL